jgi:hypothetical protein
MRNPIIELITKKAPYTPDEKPYWLFKKKQRFLIHIQLGIEDLFKTQLATYWV